MTKALNWKQRIERAKKDHRFTSTDKKLIDGFSSCIIGEYLNGANLFDVIHKGLVNNDQFILLQKLGLQALIAVLQNNPKDLEKIYNTVQRVKL